MDDRQAFQVAIRAAPLDHLLRCVFADWLDERGEVEEATRQRAWVGAYEYLLKNFVDPYWDEEDEQDHQPPSLDHALGVIEYWRDCLVRGGSVCFNTNRAAENLYDEANHPAFFRNLEIVTGTRLTPETRRQASFRCAC